MLQIYLILTFILPTLRETLLESIPAYFQTPSAQSSAVVGGLTGMFFCWAFLAIAQRILTRQLDRGVWQSIERSDRIHNLTRWAGLGCYAVFILGSGVLPWATGTDPARSFARLILQPLPMLAFLAANWAVMWSMHARTYQARFFRDLESGSVSPERAQDFGTRTQFVVDQFRNQVALVAVPILMVRTWTAITESIIAPLITAAFARPNPIATNPTAATTTPDFLITTLDITGTISMLIIAPAVLRRIWRTEKLTIAPTDIAREPVTPDAPDAPAPTPSLASTIASTIKQFRVKVKGPFIWSAGPGVANAAILGVFYPFRYLLLSHTLVESLTTNEVHSVVGHEVGHVRHRHMIWLAALVISVLTATSLAIHALAVALWTIGLPDIASTLSETAPATIISLIVLFFTFGTVSRHFEWQADAFAASATSTGDRITPEAVASMTSALQRVCLLNGMSRSRWSYRHGSIAERQHRLMTLVHLPKHRLPIDHTVLWIKALIALVGSIAILLLSGLAVVSWLFGSMQPPTP
jgi:Zn-dependent protease with chaperone function